MIRATILRAVAVGLLVAAVATDAHGQNVRSVSIADGDVTVNGDRLAPKHVPDALRAFDGRVSFTFSGDEDPLFGFGDQVYRLQGDRIVAVPNHVLKGGMVHRADLPALGPHTAFRLPAMDFSHLGSLWAESLFDPEMAVEMSERMRQLADSIHASMPPPGRFGPHIVRPFTAGTPGAVLPDDALSAIGDAVGELQALPLRIHLQREQELDAQAQELARRLAKTEMNHERLLLKEELRRHLDDVFETRQENRRAEIRELERRLEGLHERLERREELRDRIIEERLEFLLREEDPEGDG